MRAPRPSSRGLLTAGRSWQRRVGFGPTVDETCMAQLQVRIRCHAIRIGIEVTKNHDRTGNIGRSTDQLRRLRFLYWRKERLECVAMMRISLPRTLRSTNAHPALVSIGPKMVEADACTE